MSDDVPEAIHQITAKIAEDPEAYGVTVKTVSGVATASTRLDFEMVWSRSETSEADAIYRLVKGIYDRGDLAIPGD